MCESLEIAFDSLIAFTEVAGVPNSIYFPAWEGGHQDHDAAHLVGIALAEHYRILEYCYQFPLYTGVNLPSIFFRTFACLPENGEPIVSKIPWKDRIRFIKLCFFYPSQIKSWMGLFPLYMMHHIFYGTQSLQRVSVDRIKCAPHSGTLLYERRQVYNHKIFVQETCDFVNRLSQTKDDGV